MINEFKKRLLEARDEAVQFERENDPGDVEMLSGMILVILAIPLLGFFFDLPFASAGQLGSTIFLAATVLSFLVMLATYAIVLGGYWLLNTSLAYSTADEFKLSDHLPDPSEKNIRKAYLWLSAHVAFIVAGILSGLAIAVTYWKLFLPIGIVLAIIWGLMYITRRVFLLKQNLTTHENDSNAHKEEKNV